MPMPRKPDPEKYCLQCGAQLGRKMFNGTLESMNCFLRRKYCGMTCMGNDRKMDNPSIDAIRHRYQAMGLRATECQMCGTRENLCLHHVDGNPANNDRANRMTLCATCHTKWHWEHGKQPMPKTRSEQCSVCGTADRTRQGMCQMHYQRWKKYGDPLLTRRQQTGGTFEIIRVSPTHSVRRLGPAGLERPNIPESRPAPPEASQSG